MDQPIKKNQLEMIWIEDLVPQFNAIPKRYLLRQIEKKDRESYFQLFMQTFNVKSRLDELINNSLNNGFFVVEDLSTALLVSSAVAAIYPSPRHPQGASLQWVMTDELHKGNGLGSAVVASATQKLIEAGYHKPFLSTDDWRLPAISIYLKIGWKPFVFNKTMENRWKAVFTKIGLEFSTSSYELDKCNPL